MNVPHSPSLPRLVLAGCGHAHLFVLEALFERRFPGVAATLVSPAREYFYSGMESGIIAGQYGAEQARFLPERLAGAAGARWICGSVAQIDPDARRVRLSDGQELGFDVLSLDIGAGLAGEALLRGVPGSLPVKPVRDGIELAGEVDELVGTRQAGSPVRVVFVGGGAAGVELALCLAARLRRRGQAASCRVEIVEAGAEPLQEHVYAARWRIGSELRRSGIVVHSGVRVESVQHGLLLTDGGRAFPFDLLVWATGPRAHNLAGRSGLPVDGNGYVRVGRELRVQGHPEIFAAGDCASLQGYPGLPKAGVYAVRQGPVLATNLAATIRGGRLREYTPQSDWLSLLNLGDGRALMSRNGLAARGRAWWWLKDRIDRRFMDRFQRLQQHPGAAVAPGAGE